MKPQPWILSLIFSSAFLLTGIHSQAQIGNPGGWSISGTSPLNIHFAGKLVTTYNSGKGEKEGKPYFYPFIGPTGESMTRHWPQTELKPGEKDDHLHHRGIWYGLGNVNGLDFWHTPGTKKDKKFGRIIHTGINKTQLSNDSITVGTKSDWINDETEELVCQDTREFTFSMTPSGALVLDTTISLKATNGQVTIKDDKEGAWSIRVPPTMRLEGDVAKGGIVNSEAQEGRDAWGKRAKWVHYYRPDSPGAKAAGIAILDHPKNFRFPTWWHARHYGLFTANPFGQGNFEKDTKKGAGDFTIKSREALTFRYRTIFHSGSKDSINLKSEHEKFASGK